MFIVQESLPEVCSRIFFNVLWIVNTNSILEDEIEDSRAYVCKANPWNVVLSMHPIEMQQAYKNTREVHR